MCIATNYVGTGRGQSQKIMRVTLWQEPRNLLLRPRSKPENYVHDPLPRAAKFASLAAVKARKLCARPFVMTSYFYFCTVSSLPFNSLMFALTHRIVCIYIRRFRFKHLWTDWYCCSQWRYTVSWIMLFYYYYSPDVNWFAHILLVYYLTPVSCWKLTPW